MKRTLLVINSDSGNAGSVDGEVLATAFNAAGFDIVGKVTLPADALPTRTDVEAHDINTVAVCAGGGTISRMCVTLAGWEGEVFLLPGGTMNLLSRIHAGRSDRFVAIHKFCSSSGPSDIAR